MTATFDPDSPLQSIAALEQTLVENDAAIKRAGVEIERIETESRAARGRVELSLAALPAVQKRIGRAQAAQEQAVRERADLERRYTDLLERESIARSRFQQAEQRVEAYRAVEAFARGSRGASETSGDAERAARERDAEDRAGREREAAETRVAELRSISASVSHERADVEHHVFAERAVEDGVSNDREGAEFERMSHEGEIARAKTAIATFEADVAERRLEVERLEGDRTALRDRLQTARRRLEQEASSRIDALRTAEERKRLERLEAERVVAVLRAEEEGLAFERAALERAERDRVERKRMLERREAYDRALDERIARKQREQQVEPGAETGAASDAGTEAETEAEITTISPLPEAPSSRIFAVPQAGYRPPEKPAPLASPRPAAGDESMRGLFGRLGRRRREPDTAEPPIDVASRIARDFGLLGERAPAGDADRAGDETPPP